MDTTKKDYKILVIWVLLIALIVLTILYVREIKKPDSLTTFRDLLIQKSQNLSEECKDIKTTKGKERCVEALQSTNEAMETIK